MPSPKQPRTFHVKSLTEDNKVYVTKYCPEVIPAEDGYPEQLIRRWNCTCAQFRWEGVCKHAVMASYLVNEHWFWAGLEVRFEGTEFEETSQTYIKRHVKEV